MLRRGLPVLNRGVNGTKLIQRPLAPIAENDVQRRSGALCPPEVNRLAKFPEFLMYEVGQPLQISRIALARSQKSPQVSKLAWDGPDRTIVWFEVPVRAGQQEPALPGIGIDKARKETVEGIQNFPGSGGINIGTVVLVPLPVR